VRVVGHGINIENINGVAGGNYTLDSRRKPRRKPVRSKYYF
jgi:hypothetical protein